MVEYQRGSHTLHDIKYHLVWITKYRYHVLRGEVAERAREVIREICMAREVQIIRGSLAPDHVHMLVASPPKLAPAKLVQSIKGRSSRKLQQEFSELRRRLEPAVSGGILQAALAATRLSVGTTTYRL